MTDIETVRTAVTRTCCRAVERSDVHVPRFAGVPDPSNPDAVNIVIGQMPVSFTTFVEQVIAMYPSAPFVVAAAYGRILHVPAGVLSDVTAVDLDQRPDARFGVMTAVVEGPELALWATLRSIADDGTKSWGVPFLAQPAGPWSGMAGARRHAAGN